MLVLDANTGQNAVSQVKAFDDALGLTGLTITKLDGTAKAAPSPPSPATSHSGSLHRRGRASTTSRAFTPVIRRRAVRLTEPG
jgi:hypothetical protein